MRLLRRHLGDVRVQAIANRDKWKGRVAVTLCVVTTRNSALWLAQLAVCTAYTACAVRYATNEIKDDGTDSQRSKPQ